ncbi:MAG TPA: exosortase/archaeosortase family protein [Steroidobacteraceae bacterium]
MTSATAGRQAAGGLLVAFTLVAAVLALWPSVVALVDAWKVADYQHGWLIAAVSLVWCARVIYRLRSHPLTPGVPGAIILAVLLLLWLLASNANSVMMQHLLLPPVICAAVMAVAGWPIARQLLMPVAYLYFAIPVWDYALPFLQFMSVTASEAILHAMRVPATVHEYTVTLPAGTFEIIEGCSGKRYFMVALAVATLLATELPLKRAITLIVLAGALSMVANWIRIVIVIYSGYLTDMKHYFVAVEHRTLGHVIFALLIGVIIFVARRYSRVRVPESPKAFAQETASPRMSRLAARAAVPFGLLLGTFAFSKAHTSVEPAFAEVGMFPVAAGRWAGPLPPQSQWSPRYINPDSERRAAYVSAEGTIEAYANVYGMQRQGRELVFHGNSPAGDLVRVWPYRSWEITTGAGPNLSAFEARSQDGLWLVAHVFKVGGWSTPSEPLAQLSYGVKSFVHPPPAGAIVLAARCRESCESARALVTTFWDDMSASILALIPDQGR